MISGLSNGGTVRSVNVAGSFANERNNSTAWMKLVLPEPF